MHCIVCCADGCMIVPELETIESCTLSVRYLAGKLYLKKAITEKEKIVLCLFYFKGKSNANPNPLHTDRDFLGCLYLNYRRYHDVMFTKLYIYKEIKNELSYVVPKMLPKYPIKYIYR